MAPDGAIYAGAADKGRVYMVDTDDSIATAFDIDERAVSQLWFDHNLLAFTTDDAAAVYRATGRASQARYVSDVLDARAVARFGALTWSSAGKIKLETRSGNTAKPGVGWSDWQAPLQVTKLGGGSDGGKIASPAGRYLQFRVALEDDAARVRRVTSYYVPQNQPTSIQDVTIDLASKDSLPTLKDSAAKPRSPLLRVKWKIENPDSDDTTYTLEARRDGEANWRPIQTGKTPLTATSWEWNTETYPDGWYRLRVTASDAAANSPDRALTSSQTTTMFAIDNTRPVVDGLTVTYPRAQARASDALRRSPRWRSRSTTDRGSWARRPMACSTTCPRTCGSISPLPCRAVRTRSRSGSPTRPATSARCRPRSSSSSAPRAGPRGHASPQRRARPARCGRLVAKQRFASRATRWQRRMLGAVPQPWPAQCSPPPVG